MSNVGDDGYWRTTTGHRYRLSWQSVICHSPVDAIVELIYEDVNIYSSTTPYKSWFFEDYFKPEIKHNTSFFASSLDFQGQGDSRSLQHITSSGFGGYVFAMFGDDDQEGDVYMNSVIENNGGKPDVSSNINISAYYSDVDAYYESLRTYVLEITREESDAKYSQLTNVPSISDYNFTKIVPGYRGVLSLVFQDFDFSGNAPYLGPFEVVVRSISHTNFYPEKAQIGLDMNPAHMIYACFTSTEWGKGESISNIDVNSFVIAANTLYDEGFGLSMLWENESSIEEFINTICEHICGVSFEDPSTGKWSLKLFRDDYVVDDLFTLDESNSEITSYQCSSVNEQTNEMSVEYYNRDIEGNDKVTVQNLVSIASQRRIIKETKSYTGITKHDLAVRVAERELNIVSQSTIKLTIQANRNVYGLLPGELVKVNSKRYDVNNVVCRILDVNLGTLEKGTITLSLMQDVFATPTSTFMNHQATLWTPPDMSPGQIEDFKIFEMPYYMINKFAIKPPESNGSYVAVFANRVKGSWTALRMMLKQGKGSGEDLDYVNKGSSNFAANTRLTRAVDKSSTAIYFDNIIDSQTLDEGKECYIFINDEIMYCTAYKSFVPALPVVRGTMDTLPSEHPIDSKVYIVFGDIVYDTSERLDGEVVNVKLQAETSTGKTALNQVIGHDYTVTGRYQRPYPPGNVLVNNKSWPEYFGGAITLSWSHRNRHQQTLPAPDSWYSGSVTNEPNVTYTVTIINTDSGAVLKHQSLITDPWFRYLDTDEFNDHGGLATNYRIKITSCLNTEVGEVTSLYPFVIDLWRVT